jgi:cell shape-determining protein MreC
MQYHRNRNTKRASALKVLLYACIVAAVVFVDSLFGAPLKTVTHTFVTPMFATAHNLTTGKLAAYFVSKETLKKENDALQQTIGELKYQQLTHGILQQDSKHFCAIEEDVSETQPSATPGEPPIVTTHTVKKPGAFLENDIAARVHGTGKVIAYERVLLGTMIVQFENEKPNVGDFVLDDVGYPLGVVQTVHEGTAAVQLLTMINTTHEIRIGKIVAQAHGRLSNTFIAFIPQEEVVEVGDTVSLTALSAPLGSVVKVERSPADAQVLVFVRPFARPLDTHFVSFIRNPLAEHHE